MDEPVSVRMLRRLRYQMHATAPNTATSRQPPSASPIARPGPASWVAAESLLVGGGAGEDTPASGDGGGGDGAAMVGVARGRAA